jgi:hypothetical protein
MRERLIGSSAISLHDLAERWSAHRQMESYCRASRSVGSSATSLPTRRICSASPGTESAAYFDNSSLLIRHDHRYHHRYQIFQSTEGSAKQDYILYITPAQYGTECKATDAVSGEPMYVHISTDRLVNLDSLVHGDGHIQKADTNFLCNCNVKLPDSYSIARQYEIFILYICPARIGLCGAICCCGDAGLA